MPELPEVETIRRDLAAEVIGRKIEAVFLYDPQILKEPDPEAFLVLLRGRTIERIDRQAKYLLIHLSGGLVWMVHLMLEGQFLYQHAAETAKPDTRLAVHLDNDHQLRLRDVTGYAKTMLVPEAGHQDTLKLKLLGPEPIAPGFTFERFKSRLTARKGMIKPLLLKQQVIAGVGNIYADEALHRARLHPRRKVAEMSDQELQRLHRALVDVLNEGIAHRGTSAQGGLYRDIWGRKGKHQEHLEVFRRAGQPCPACGGEVEKTQVSGRSTFLCPTCQRL
ncbi:MAG: bifunctional DNA-formamidopyrimidine glycosylase/DNA-(apurinic or apyrimidinic site) lyase [Candidatus Sericytochromatia bacterium]